jgi:hypothetical protein
MIAANKVVVLIVAFSITTPIAADRAYSTDQSDYSKHLRAKSVVETEVPVATFSSAAAAAAGHAETTIQHTPVARQNDEGISLVTKALLLVALFFYIKFLSPWANSLSGLCRDITDSILTLKSQSRGMFHRRCRQKRRRSSCSSGGATTKYRNVSHERNGKDANVLATPISEDEQSMSSSIMEILALTELEDDNDEDASFVSSNSSISTELSFITSRRSRRSAYYDDTDTCE